MAALSVQHGAAARMLSAASVVLLDFDGPICSVFASLTAVGVAEDLRGRLARAGADLPPDLAGMDDPHLLLRRLPGALLSRGASDGEIRLLTRQFHDWLSGAERMAVKSARATPGASEAISGLIALGKTVRIVSNNAAAAIVDYLCRDGVKVGAIQAEQVFGRPDDPHLMKPNPHLLLEALKSLGPLGDAGHCVFIGDAPSDVSAAAEAGVKFIGFTGGAEARQKRLLDAGADPEALIQGWSDLGDLSLLV
ncbi:HAD family hydrolase [Streptacidiphilus sp. EB103A]|uniref:HAD family hydrolase n=1 Tax=Streptacidiphilus sp. EB103A TaxID=3156275 RepID=UPI003518A2AE